jgi:hypothetical protein
VSESLDIAYNCNDPLLYIPDSLSYNQVIRVVVHFVDAKSGDKNFSEVAGKKYMNRLIREANQRLIDNHKMNLPPGNKTPNLNPKFSYKIHPATSDPADDGFYWHYDDALYAFVHKGKHRNNYKKDVINKYALKQDSIINIFILPHHPDSVLTKTYKPKITGIALGTSLKMSGLYENPDEPWLAATLLNHEVAHILGLGHSWVTNDGCDDTPPNANCWEPTGIPPCDSVISNNLMDYNNSQMAITPCQLGRIHSGFARTNSKARKLIEAQWCQPDTNSCILIKEKTIWPRARDINRDIIIEENAYLEVHCRLSMARGRKIIIKPGGKLILVDLTIHNACGDQWEGIFIEKKGKKIGQIDVFGATTIADVRRSSKMF